VKPVAKRRRWLLIAVTLLTLGLAGYVVYGGGSHQGPGEITGPALPEAAVAARYQSQSEAASSLPEARRRILFGDMHVHTTFSADAFMRSLPPVGGEGLFPPADACDYARYCSQLDFFALTDHAEALTSQHWQESKESIRQCNAVAGDAADPDLVAYMGFEWTQVGMTPETHYGHKNVIFRDLADDELPARPIAAPVLGDAFRRTPVAKPWLLPLFPLMDFENRDRYMDVVTFVREMRGVPDCPDGVDTRELPAECRELAQDPAALFEKLDQWGFDSVVIPHGTTWGFYTPPGYSWDKQIDPAQDDPARQNLVEVYSGHGNSEVLRPWRAFELGADGELICPAPVEGYEPCCHRAGEIVRARCGDVSSEVCEERVHTAQQDYIAMGVGGHLSIPGSTVEDWGDCGQCKDCVLPAFNYRPGGSAQYMLARAHFAEGQEPVHQRLGFMASSDNHTARPGTGYKESGRRSNTEATGPVSAAWRERVFGTPPPRSDTSVRLSIDELMSRPPFAVVDLERQASFFTTGGLVAVQADGRDRESIWAALRERRVYGTSGDRILLWFDMLNAPDGVVSMGSEARAGESPRFRVHAVGAFEQRDGCPDWVHEAVSQQRLSHLCLEQCYFPSDTRKRIVRIEVVRIRPQQSPDEDVNALVEDPWRSFPCSPDAAGCSVEFDDPEFALAARPAAYYVRAIEEASDVINGANLRCDAEGHCDPCYADYRGDATDDCLAPVEERAWSSPIWVDFDPSLVPPPVEADADAGVSD